MNIRSCPYDNLPIDLIRVIESYLAFWDFRTISQYSFSSPLYKEEYFAWILLSDSKNRVNEEWKRIISYFLSNISLTPIASSMKFPFYTEETYKKMAEEEDPKCEKSIRLFHDSLRKAARETDFKEEKRKNAFFKKLYTDPNYPPRLHFFIIALRQQKEAYRELSRILQDAEFYRINDLPATTILHCFFILGMMPTEIFEERHTTNSQLVKMAVKKSSELYFKTLSALLILPIQPFTPHFSVLNLLGQVLWYSVTHKTIAIRKQGIIDILHLAGDTLERKKAIFEFFSQISYIRILQNSPYANNHRHILAPSYITNIKHLPLDHRHLRISNQELTDMEALADEMLSPLYEKMVHYSDNPLTEDEKKQDVAITIKNIHAINNFQSLNQRWEIYMKRPSLCQTGFFEHDRFKYNKPKQTIIQAFQERAFALLSAENKKDSANIETIEQCKNLLRSFLFGEEKLNHYNKKQTDHELGGVSPRIRFDLEEKLFESLQELSLRGELNKIPEFKKLAANFQTRHDLSKVNAPENVISAVDEIIKARIMYWVFESSPPTHRLKMGLDYDAPRISSASSSSSSSPRPSSSSSLSLVHSVTFPTSTTSTASPKPSAPPESLVILPPFPTPSAPPLPSNW